MLRKAESKSVLSCPIISETLYPLTLRVPNVSTATPIPRRRSPKQFPNRQQIAEPFREIGPQPGPQTKILSSRADIGIFGGAAFGGKTFSLLLEGCRHLSTPGFGAVFFRRTMPEITAQGGAWDKSEEIFYPLGGQPSYSEMKWYFPIGDQYATFGFRALQHVKDIPKLGSSQIPLILIDEGTTFPESMFWALMGRNRTDIAGISPYCRIGCNPDPDSWLKEFIQWWIDPASGFPIMERSGRLRWFVRESNSIYWGDSRAEMVNRFGPEAEPLSVTFVPSTIADNPIGRKIDPGYEAKLKSLPHVDRMRLLGDAQRGGNWLVRQSSGMFRAESLRCNIRPDHPPDITWVRYWDTAATDEDEEGGSVAAYTCGCLIGKDAHDRFWIADITRARVAGKDRDDLMRGTAILDRATYGYVKIWAEQEPGGAGKTDAAAIIRLLAGFDVEVERATGDKVTRAKPLASQCQGRNVYIVARPGQQWVDPFIRELEAFPKSKYKDQADAASGGFSKVAEMSSPSETGIHMGSAPPSIFETINPDATR